MKPISAADLAHMPWPARKRIQDRNALEAKIRRGHGGNPTPAEFMAAAEAVRAGLPVDPHAAEHRLTLSRALSKGHVA